MITTNQLKAHVRNKSVETGIPNQALIQYFMMERFLARISQSPYYDAFILKGGFLIGSLIGVKNRTTIDLDATITGITLEEETITKVLEEICKETHEDGIEFTLEKISPIREEDDYPGFRASLIANLSNMRTPFKLDIGTGDAITPNEVEHTHLSIFQKIPLFTEEKIRILSYPIQTILAEKVETVLRRGVLNTRTRDFYDIYMLMRAFKNELIRQECSEALMNTMRNRKSVNYFKDYKEIIDILRDDPEKYFEWRNYQNQFTYAKGIDFTDTLKECENFCDFVSPYFIAYFFEDYTT